MICVYAHRTGSRCRLLVEGHADFSSGDDIVCAGVSAITGALIGFAADKSAAHHLRADVSHGRAFLSCRGGLGVAFDAAVYGLCRIAEKYPDHVRVLHNIG